MKVMYNFSFIILVVFSCSNYNKSNSEDLNNISLIDTMEKVQEDSLIIECHCLDSLHKIKVVSEYLENANSSDSILILSQKVIFLKQNNPIKTIEMPFRKTRIERYGKKFIVLNTVLYKAKCVTSEKGKVIYSFYGAHAFDPQHEFFGFYSDIGKLLWHYYGDRYEVFSTSGNEDRYVKEFGEELNSLDSMIRLIRD